MKPGRGRNGRIKFGTESSGGFRNVTIDNCTFRGCKGLALEEVDGGILENITIKNISMMDVASYPIYITTGKRNRTPNLTTVSRMKNILISNIIATGIDSQSGIQIAGLPDQPIEGLRLENIRLVFNGGGTAEQAAQVPAELGTGYPEPRGIMPAYGLFARHVKDLELANINVSFAKDDFRPAIECLDVNGLEIDNFKAQLAGGVAASKFEKCFRPRHPQFAHAGQDRQLIGSGLKLECGRARPHDGFELAGEPPTLLAPCSIQARLNSCHRYALMRWPFFKAVQIKFLVGRMGVVLRQAEAKQQRVRAEDFLEIVDNRD